MSRTPAEGSGGDERDEREPMDELLTALRGVAREEDAAAAACPDDQVPQISETLRAQISAEAVRRLTGGAVAVRGASQPGGSVATGSVAGDQLAARREQRARAGSRRMVWSLGTVALAAAAALVLWNRAPHTPAENDGAGALPDYAVVASGGLAETRGGGQPSATDEGTAATTTAPVRLDDSSELRVVCRPDSGVAGAVAARAFLVHDGVATEVMPAVKIAPTGAVELRLRGAELRGGAPTHAGGASRVLRIAVGRPASIRAVAPSDAVVAGEPGRSRPDETGARRWLTVPLDLRDQQR